MNRDREPLWHDDLDRKNRTDPPFRSPEPVRDQDNRDRQSSGDDNDD